MWYILEHLLYIAQVSLLIANQDPLICVSCTILDHLNKNNSHPGGFTVLSTPLAYQIFLFGSLQYIPHKC